MLPEVAKSSYNTHEHPIVEVCYHISPSSIFVKKERYSHDHFRSAKQIRNEVHLKSNLPSDDLSLKSARRMRRSIEWLVASSPVQRIYSKELNRAVKFQINFITLTLAEPQAGWTDRQIKSKLLQPWFKRMAYHHGLSNYVWKAEPQANGNIHFHIISDKFIHYESIRWHWNQLLRKNGCMDKFTAKHGHSNPNSTDVHSVRKVNNLAAYLAKYFAKANNDRRAILGRQWGCSYSLSRSNTCCLAVEPDRVFKIQKEVAFDQLTYSAIETEPNMFGRKNLVGEIFYIDQNQWNKIITGEIAEVYMEHLAQIRSGNDLFFLQKKLEQKEKKERRKQAIATAKALFNAGIDELAQTPSNYFKSKNPPVFQVDLFQSPDLS